MNNLNSDKFYLFGAGNTAKLCFSILKEKNKQVVSFLKSEGDSTEIENIPVISISNNSAEIDLTIPVIIAVFNRDDNANYNSIDEFLRKKSIIKIISFYDFFEYYLSDQKNIYWLTKRSFYKKNIDKFFSIKKLFKDSHSIEVFDKITNFLTTFDYRILPYPNTHNQYFPSDVEVWNGENAFFDIGSYDAQTIIDLYNLFGKLKKVIVYEPDPDNINKIKNKITIDSVAEEVFIIPCGIWSTTKMLRFSSGEGESSSINSLGETIIQGISLDETLIGITPGYIKMDIEGAEIEALKGSENIIKKYKPSLAVCLYHKPEHFYEIPSLINSWGLDYNFYIRLHGNNLFETVLYCVPNKN